MYLRKHINNKDVAMEVLRSYRIPGKDLVEIKCKWWRVSEQRNKPLYSMGVVEKHCIPLSIWVAEWRYFPHNYDGILEAENA